MSLDYLKLAQDNKQYTEDIRRHLHLYPEVSDKEYNTLSFINEKLSDLKIEHFEVENGGIFGIIRGELSKSDRTILLRADIDALPVQESVTNLKKEKVCVSTIPGVSHVCGHDAHTAMLLTSARILNENRSAFAGNVILMFERGEEGTENIYYLMKYLQDNNICIHGTYSMHMAPMISSGQIAIQSDSVMAGICAFKCKIKGSCGHGARPDLSANPIDCFAAIHSALESFRLTKVSPFETFTCSICSLECGTQINTIPGEMTFGGTARFYETDIVGRQFKETFRQICEGMAKIYKCTVEYPLFIGPTNALKNNYRCAELAREFIAPVIGKSNVIEIQPLMCTESMADMHMYYPGVYCLLGTNNQETGTGADLHEAAFDVDENVLPLGVASELSYVINFLALNEQIEHPAYDVDLDVVFNK